MAHAKRKGRPPLQSQSHRFGPRRVTKSAQHRKRRPVTGESGPMEDIEKTIGKSGGRSPTLEVDQDVSEGGERQ